MAVPQLTRWGGVEPNPKTSLAFYICSCSLVNAENSGMNPRDPGGCLLVRERNRAPNSISGSKWAFLVSAY